MHIKKFVDVGPYHRQVGMVQSIQGTWTPKNNTIIIMKTNNILCRSSLSMRTDRASFLDDVCNNQTN